MRSNLSMHRNSGISLLQEAETMDERQKKLGEGALAEPATNALRIAAAASGATRGVQPPINAASAAPQMTIPSRSCRIGPARYRVFALPRGANAAPEILRRVAAASG